MLEKPDLADEQIITCLREHYGISVAGIEFLPIGNDATAWVYRVLSEDGQAYFLKIKNGKIYAPSVLVPRYLKQQGIEQVVAPISAKGNDLWPNIGQFALLLYPFIEGQVGMEVGLSDRQWIDLGTVLRKIHSMRLPAALESHVARETFIPKWSGWVREFQASILAGDFADPIEKELAAFWKTKREEIARIVDRTEELGRLLQHHSPAFVLCHTDIHTANVLLDADGRLHIVDWDTPLIAPKERDLMFVVGDKHQESFFRGYGKTEVDHIALAYYRYEWVVQELGDFGERIFVAENIGEETKRDAVRGFKQLFLAGDVVDAAYAADR